MMSGVFAAIFPSTPSSPQKIVLSAKGKVQAQQVEVQACRLPAKSSGAGRLRFQSPAQILCLQ